MRAFAIAAALILSVAGSSVAGVTRDTYVLPAGMDAATIARHWNDCRNADGSARARLCTARGVPLGKGDAGLETSARVGEELVILVPGAPGSDFYWKATRVRRLDQVGTPVVQQAPKGLIPLRTGQYVTVFRFKATAAGAGEIELSNVRRGAGGGDASERLKYPVRIN